MLGSNLPAPARRFAAAAPALALILLSGCDPVTTGSYPSDLQYPPRHDPIVTEVPGEERFYADQPGTIERLVDRIGPTDKGGIGGKAVNPVDAPADKRRQLEDELRKVFGTPFTPTVTISDEDAKAIGEEIKADLDLKDFDGDPVKSLQLASERLSIGSQLYRRHCLTCHGLAGDGRGPTGPWVNPHPRDYRKGAFKFMSTDAGKIQDNTERKPHRADLLRTLNVGVDGTTMPSSSLLTANDLEALVSYILHLSIRGEVEYGILPALVAKDDLPDLDGNPAPDATMAVAVRYFTKKLVKAWARSNLPATVLQPPKYPYDEDNEAQRTASVRRGYEIFTNSTAGDHPEAIQGGAGCISCHQDFGRQVNFKYDQWGTLVRPANLTTGIFRGGRRPLDIYWRIRGGIVPSQMPVAPDLTGINRADLDKNLKDDQPFDPYWDLVNFIVSVPYPEMLPKDVRAKVYPPAEASAETQHASR